MKVVPSMLVYLKSSGKALPYKLRNQHISVSTWALYKLAHISLILTWDTKGPRSLRELVYISQV
jgi:hypothetical protein